MRAAYLIAAPLLLASLAGAQAHQCYRRVVEPPQFSTVQEQVLISPGREVAETSPALTRQIEETVVVRPAQQIAHVIPAQFGYQYETVLVSPPRKEWRVRDEGGEVIGCWVNVPPIYGRVAHRVEIQPEREVTETIPEQLGTRVRTEVVEPERTIYRTIPPQYATRERLVQVAPASARWAPIEQTCGE